MSKKVSKRIRNRVAIRANFRCGYCLVHEEDMFFPFQVDHIISRKHRVSSDFDNLAFAYSVCNQNKGTDIATYLVPKGPLIPLFNPRTEVWSDHFKLENGRIIPQSNVGGATALVLNFNNDDRVILRQLLSAAGRYP